MSNGNGFLTALTYLTGSMPFYISTLEEVKKKFAFKSLFLKFNNNFKYYNEIMFLPAINGATEGILFVAFYNLLPALYGNFFIIIF